MTRPLPSVVFEHLSSKEVSKKNTLQALKQEAVLHTSLPRLLHQKELGLYHLSIDLSSSRPIN